VFCLSLIYSRRFNQNRTFVFMFYNGFPYKFKSFFYNSNLAKGEVMQSLTVTVVIPAYNEEKTIGSVIFETASIMNGLNLPYEIIVVDDGSTDETGKIASAYKVIVLSNERNRGKGYSLRRALQHANGDIIVTIDSDGEHKPKEIPDLIEPLFNGTDIVAGSRFLGRSGWGTTHLNILGNLFFTAAIMTLTGKVVTDSQTGFRAIKKRVLDALNLESDGYEVEAEITIKGLKSGFVFKEKPITVERRKYSFSKLRLLSDGTRIMKTILKANFSQLEHDSN
jgi:glycosyltransferase involved in cell wall biosynthesis